MTMAIKMTMAIAMMMTMMMGMMVSMMMMDDADVDDSDFRAR